jgi:hypothetical protein
VLFSAGDDGWVRAWKVADIEAAAEAASQAARQPSPSAAAPAGASSAGVVLRQDGQQPQLKPVAQMQLQHAPSALAVTSTQMPAAQSLAVYQQQGQVLVGE